MNIISRKKAKAIGLPYYFTGNPCIHGHIAERPVRSRICVECKKEWDKKSYEANPELKISYSKKYREENPEHYKNYYKENIEFVKASHKKYKKENPHKNAATTKKYRASKLHRTPSWADLKKIEEVYFEAACLTKETGIKYDVDHIIPLQGEYVSGLHIASNLQVITHTANCKKGNSFIIS